MLSERAVTQALDLAKQARQGRALPWSHLLERAALGRPTPPGAVRADVLARFDRMVLRLAGDLPADVDPDLAGDARFEAASSIVVRAPVMTGRWFLEYAVTKQEPPEPRPGMFRAALRNMLQVVAGGVDDVGLTELVAAARLLGHASGDPDPDTDSAGTETGDPSEQELTPAERTWTLPAMRERLATMAETELIRALEAVQFATTYQTMVLLFGIPAAFGADVDYLPPELAHFTTAEALQRLRADPMWQAWGQHNMSLSTRPRLRLDTLATAAALVL